MQAQRRELYDRVLNCDTYAQAMRVFEEYVEIRVMERCRHDLDLRYCASCREHPVPVPAHGHSSGERAPSEPVTVSAGPGDRMPVVEGGRRVVARGR